MNSDNKTIEDQYGNQKSSRLRRAWRWVGLCLTLFVVTGAIIYREWITAGLFLSMGIGYQIDPNKSKTHYAAFIMFEVAMIVFGTAYLLFKMNK